MQKYERPPISSTSKKHLLCVFQSVSKCLDMKPVNWNKSKFQVKSGLCVGVRGFHAQQLIIWACLSFQPEDWLCDWSQTADRPGGAAHPGFDDAHEYLHAGERNLDVPPAAICSSNALHSRFRRETLCSKQSTKQCDK